MKPEYKQEGVHGGYTRKENKVGKKGTSPEGKLEGKRKENRKDTMGKH